MKKRISNKSPKKQIKHKKSTVKPIVNDVVLGKMIGTSIEPIEIIQDSNIPVTDVVETVVPETIVDGKKVISRGRKKSTNKMYFTSETEDAIELYNNTECIEAREKIFREKIQYPFEKLVENVFNTFKFSYFETGPLDVQKETVSHLVANIQKFQKDKGRAFAYFSIVAKHYLIFLNNSNYKRFNQLVEIGGDDREENTVQLQTEDKHHKNVEMTEFMKLMIKYWETNVGKIFSKQRDLNIANAVIELFRNSDRIDAFNKKALYLYIREISNCKTQQITKVINKMKTAHQKINSSYINNGFISNVA